MNAKILGLPPCAWSSEGWVWMSAKKSNRFMLLPCTFPEEGKLSVTSVLVIGELLVERISLSDSDLLKDDLQIKNLSL